LPSLVLTRPGWPHPLQAYTVELAQGLQAIGVDLFSAPLQRFVSQPLAPALREQWLASLKKSQSERIWLVSSSPSAAYAFVQQPALLKDLQKVLRDGRLVLSGIGRASMLPLIRWMEESGETAPIFSPEAQTLSDEGASGKLSVTSADASAYLRWVSDKPVTADAMVLLEASQNREDLSVGLVPLCKQVIRLPIYRREALPMPVFSPRPRTPTFVLVTSSSLVTAAIEGCRQQDLPLESVIWMSHHPAIVRALRERLPGAECLQVDSLEVDKIVQSIKLRS